MELRHRALDAFLHNNAVQKAAAVEAIGLQLASLSVDPVVELPWPDAPGRPALPALVEPKAVPRRSPFTPAGLAALLHSIAHIEFNAINLALDAVWRFPGMPQTYYLDLSLIHI